MENISKVWLNRFVDYIKRRNVSYIYEKYKIKRLLSDIDNEAEKFMIAVDKDIKEKTAHSLIKFHILRWQGLRRNCPVDKYRWKDFAKDAIADIYLFI